MKWHIKKLVPFIATTFLIVTTQLFAVMSDCTFLGCELPSCKSYQECGWTFNADVLYWKARGSNITYNSDYLRGVKRADFTELRFEENPQEEIEQEISLVSSLLKEKKLVNKSLRFQSDLGYRLGLCYKKPCSCFSFCIDWTHFHNKARGEAKPFKPEVLAKVRQKCEYEIDAKWDLCLDYGDIQVTREMCVDNCLTVTPFFGLRWARIKQDYKSCAEFFYESQDDFVIPDFPSETLVNDQVIDFVEDFFDVKESHRFAGAGPRIGLDLEWSLNPCLSVYGNAAFSYILGYSCHRTKACADLGRARETLTAIDEGFDEEVEIDSDIVERFNKDNLERCLDVQANRPVTDLAIGLRFVPLMQCCPYAISFQFGFEHHAFFGQKHAIYNELENPLRNCTSTLAVYGFSFRTNISF